MTYFTIKDHQALANTAPFNAASDNDAQRVYDKFFELHKALHRRLRDHNYDLHAHWERAEILSSRSATSMGETEALALSYFRSREQARLVEKLMGRDGLDWHTDVEMHRHPVIELRLTPRSFAVELVVSPFAWLDQQNAIGKLAIARHRETFRSIIQRIPGDFCFGFWEGVELSDVHLTTQQLVRGSNLAEWMSTFCDGQDWLRIGAWYEPGDPALDAGRILTEMTQRVGALYRAYTFLLWTSNNDFLSFYRKYAGRGAEMVL